MPPTTRTCPLFKVIALCPYRLVLRLAPVVGDVTTRTVLPTIDPVVAVIVEFPVPAALANPLPLTVTAALLEDAQVLDEVRSWVLPSVYMPVAVSCCEPPVEILAASGLIAIDANEGGLTVREAEAVRDSKLAVIVEEPWATVAASPVMPTLATDVVLEDQSINVVTSCTDPLL